jgi:predicted component of type VI protein secretion system
MPAQLIALNDGPSILVDKPILLLGRHPECDIQIDSRKISRRHCCVAQVEDYLVVRDLDSTNGIRINGVRVIEGKLRPGDELTVGSHRYQVAWDDDPGRPAAKARAPLAAALEDDDLESCDEPVALPDPGRAMPRAMPANPGPIAPGSTRPKPPIEDDSVVLPDNLNLIPNSGSLPGLAGPQAGPRPK